MSTQMIDTNPTTVRELYTLYRAAHESAGSYKGTTVEDALAERYDDPETRRAYRDAVVDMARTSKEHGNRVCQYCDKVFKSALSRASHERTAHRDQANDADAIVDDYVNTDMTLREMEAKWRVTASTINRFVRAAGVPMRSEAWTNNEEAA